MQKSTTKRAPMHRPYGTARAVATGAILLACGRACDAAREVSLANLVDVSWEPAGSAAIEFHVRQRAGPAEGLRFADRAGHTWFLVVFSRSLPALFGCSRSCHVQRRGLALVVGGSGSEASAFVASWDSRTASGGLVRRRHKPSRRFDFNGLSIMSVCACPSQVQQVGQTSGATWMASHDVGPPAAAEVHVEPGGLLSFSFVSPLAPKCGGPGDKASPGPLRVPAVASLVDRLRQRSLRSAAGAGALGLPRCEGADLAAPGATLTLHAAFLVEDSALSATAGGPSSLVVAASTAPATFDLRTGAPARARAASSEASAPVAQPSRRSAMVMAGANLTTSEMAMGSMHTAFFDQGYGWGPLMFQQAYITSGGELAAAIILCGLFGAFATATVVAGKRLESIGSSPAASLGWVAVGVVSTAIRTGSHYVAMLLVRLASCCPLCLHIF